jgi:predicted phage tail protein
LENKTKKIMTQKEQLRALVKSMISEAVSLRIKEIDAAGDVAANEAKMTRIGQEADKAKKVMELMKKVNLSHYIGEKLTEKVMQEMDKTINEYEGARLELEEKMSGPKDDNKKGKKKGGKDAKKADEPKEEVLETEEPVVELEIDATQL